MGGKNKLDSDETRDDDGGANYPQDPFLESMRQFAEGATAMTAASIRMQMMMLEDARGMIDDVAAAFGETQTRKEPE